MRLQIFTEVRSLIKDQSEQVTGNVLEPEDTQAHRLPRQ